MTDGKVAYIRASNIYDDSRATKEIMALVEVGYRVKVFAWNRDGMAEIRCGDVFGDTETVEFVFYEAEASKGIGMRNISKLIGWFRWLRRQLDRTEGIFIVHACDLDCGICAWRYCVKNKIKLVYDIFDYYVDAHTMPQMLKALADYIETKVVDASDVTIICTEERREQIKNARPKRVIVICNSPDIQEVPRAENEYDYVYCGTLTEKRLIGEILEDYPQHSRMRMAFGGYGVYADQAEKLAGQCERFAYFGALKYADVLDLEAKTAVLSAIYEPTLRIHRLCAPNKFYEALALGKPVIVCRGTGIDKIVEENGIGVVIDYDVKAFYEALTALLDDSVLRSEMGAKARKLYLSKYQWSAMKELLQSEYKGLSGSCRANA